MKKETAKKFLHEKAKNDKTKKSFDKLKKRIADQKYNNHMKKKILDHHLLSENVYTQNKARKKLATKFMLKNLNSYAKTFLHGMWWVFLSWVLYIQAQEYLTNVVSSPDITSKELWIANHVANMNTGMFTVMFGLTIWKLSKLRFKRIYPKTAVNDYIAQLKKEDEE